MQAAVVAIDGSILEGGGQILRNAAALSAICRTPITVDKIRAGREKPGLSAQHLTGLQLVQRICGEGAALTGGSVRSTRVELNPSDGPRAGEYVADTKTAGSCTLLAQTALPCLLFAQPAGSLSSLQLKGGTDAAFAPPVDYLAHVLAPTLRRLLGLDFQVDVVRRGFFPKGGGCVSLAVRSLGPGAALPAFNMTQRGQVISVTVRTYGAGRTPDSAHGRMADAAAKDLRAALGRGIPIHKEPVRETPASAVGDGAGIIIIAETDTGCLFGASASGERGVLADATGSIVAAEMVAALQSGACVDEWMQDQLIIFAALASGVSQYVCAEPSLHTRTAMVIAESLLPGAKFTLHKLSGGDGGPNSTASAAPLYRIECRGAGCTQPCA